jgi:hypothetical protein
MSMSFQDSIVGGTSLRIPAIQSPNFSIAAETGWAIFSNGDAYFYDLTAFGNIVAGSIVNTPIGGSTITNSTFIGGTIDDTTITFDSSGGALLMYATATENTFLTASGTWTAPAGVTAVKAECWGGGAGGGSGESSSSRSDGGGGGGSGEYAQEPSLAVTPGDVYTFTVGAGGAGGSVVTAGGTTTFPGDSVSVVANGAPSGNFVSPGTGGTGSANSIHFNGGNGGNGSGSTVPSDSAGGGGGGSPSQNNGGGTGGNASGATPGAGGSSAFGGPGGAGSAGGSAVSGVAGTVPGGGGGGGNGDISGSGAGAGGRVKLTWMTANELVGSIAPAAGTDQYGNSYVAGFAIYNGTGTVLFQAALSGNVTVGGTLGVTGVTTLGNQEVINSANTGGALAISQSVPTTGSPGTVSINESAATNNSVGVYVSGDADPRFGVTASGKISWGSGAAAVDTDLYRVTAGKLGTDTALAVGTSLVVGTTGSLGDNGVGKVDLANAATVPTTDPTGGGILYANQGVPSWRDTAGLLLGMVRAYSARSSGNLTNPGTGIAVPGASVNVVVTGSNATVQITTSFDISASAAGTAAGILHWNGMAQAAMVNFSASAAGQRSTNSETYTITGVTAGTYPAALFASSSGAATIEGTHTGMNILVIDQ